MPRIFIGKSPTEVLRTLPLIYSICRNAQGCAAVEAVEQALTRPATATWCRKRRLLVAFETIKEQLWRIELDWTRSLGRTADSAPVVQVLSLMREFRASLFPQVDPFQLNGLETDVNEWQLHALLDQLERLLQERIFSSPVQYWLSIDNRHDLVEWSEKRNTLAQQMLFQVQQRYPAGFGHSRILPLPELEPEYLRQRLCGVDADRFIAQPDWHGSPRETSAFTRHSSHPLLRDLAKEDGNGLLPRLTARLVELAELIGEIRSGCEALQDGDDNQPIAEIASGIGISQVEAARGRLVHRVELEGGLVANYQIVAPTEWNFHPRGVLVESLYGMPADSVASLKSIADLLISAIDPCVGYRLRINGTELEQGRSG